MKIPALVAALLFALVQPAAAATISDPVKFVKGVYADIIAGKSNPLPDDVYTPRLKALFALDTREANGEVGRIDFDIFMNAQDAQISKLKVWGTPVAAGPGREVVAAKFLNGHDKEEVHFYFERINGRWLLDDARGLTGEEPWTLSLILKYGWDGKN